MSRIGDIHQAIQEAEQEGMNPKYITLPCRPQRRNGDEIDKIMGVEVIIDLTLPEDSIYISEDYPYKGGIA